MSVVVRMEMPKNCFECPFSIIDDTADGAWCNALGKQVYYNRDEDCPIVCQLPKGHGDLIDRKKLLRNKRHIFETTGGCFPKSEWFIKLDDVFRSKAIVQAERSET